MASRTLARRVATRGDRDIEISVSEYATLARPPVDLIDDIISSGRTMEAASKRLLALGFTTPIILGVHGLFAGDAFERLKAAGAAHIVSTNSVPHASSQIDISDLMVTAAIASLTARQG